MHVTQDDLIDNGTKKKSIADNADENVPFVLIIKGNGAQTPNVNATWPIAAYGATQPRRAVLSPTLPPRTKCPLNRHMNALGLADA